VGIALYPENDKIYDDYTHFWIMNGRRRMKISGPSKEISVRYSSLTATR
jgi:hypothetical protein